MIGTVSVISSDPTCKELTMPDLQQYSLVCLFNLVDVSLFNFICGFTLLTRGMVKLSKLKGVFAKNERGYINAIKKRC